MMNLQQYFYSLAIETGAQEFTLVTDHARSDLNHRNHQHLSYSESPLCNVEDDATPNPTRRERYKALKELSIKNRSFPLKNEPSNMSLDSVFDELDKILSDDGNCNQFEKLRTSEKSKISRRYPRQSECSDDLLVNSPGLARRYELCNGYNAHIAKSNGIEVSNQFRIHLDPVGYQHYRHGERSLLPTKAGPSNTYYEFQTIRIVRRNSINSGYTSSNRHKLQSQWDDS
eukprot:scaffold6749_cov113-Cylindrotheca_fusiformis.AAC.3